MQQQSRFYHIQQVSRFYHVVTLMVQISIRLHLFLYLLNMYKSFPDINFINFVKFMPRYFFYFVVPVNGVFSFIKISNQFYGMITDSQHLIFQPAILNSLFNWSLAFSKYMSSLLLLEILQFCFIFPCDPRVFKREF